MNERESIVLTEQQAVERLAAEKWERRGNTLVSRDSFAPAVVSQYLTPLSQPTRDALKVTAERNTAFNASKDSEKLVMNAPDADKFFATQGFSLAITATDHSTQW